MFGCSAVAKDREVSLHRFPKEKGARQAWVRFVRRTRVWEGPTDSSTVCSQHFTPADFSNLTQFTMGFSKGLKLQPAAVPSVPPNVTSATAAAQPATARATARPAARKRELHRVSNSVQEEVDSLIESDYISLKRALEKMLNGNLPTWNYPAGRRSPLSGTDYQLKT